MWEIISSNKRLFWVLIVIVFTVIVRFIAVIGFNFFIKKDLSRSGNNQSTLILLKKIIIAFIYVFAVLLGSYALFEKEVYETINSNIKTVLWITTVMVFAIIGAALSQRYFNRKIDEASNRDKNDPTTYKFLNYFSSFTIYFVGICLAAFAIPSLRSLAQSALAGAGVLAIIGGVASQEALSNLVGGIFIVFFKPYRIGDFVRIGADIIGQVEDLTLRHTVINDFHNKRIVIPNSVMNKEKVINYNLGEQKICEWIAIGISYDSDIDKALAIMEEETLNHPNCIDYRTAKQKKAEEPQVLVKVTGLGDSSVNLRAWAWAKDYRTAVSMRHDLYKTIKERFTKEGIEIPFPHRTIVYKNNVQPHPEKALEAAI